MGLYDNVTNPSSVAITRSSGQVSLPPGHSPQYQNSATYANPNQIYGGTSPQGIASIQSALVTNGYLAGEYRNGGWDTQSREAMEEAIADARFNDMTLSEWLQQGAGGGDSSDGYYGSGGSGGGSSGGPTTYTSTSVSLTARPTAKAVLKQALQTWMGRAPTNKEVSNFLTGLNKDERANPSVTTTTSDGSGNSTSVSKASPIEPGAEAEQFAENKIPQKEAEKFQTANYMSALGAMLGVN